MRWNEMDANGHVNNSVFMQYFVQFAFSPCSLMLKRPGAQYCKPCLVAKWVI
ncbi:MAG: hypothetical protein K8S54_06770 [Spirochaetia bacterium]|nr:hypothetical protein [Spirochaetia bacterium]